MTPDMNAVVERLERLERENRRLKVLGLILVAAVSLAVLTGVTTKEPVIGAEAFTLVGNQGQLRGVFALVNQEPTLALFDSTGKVRAGLSIAENAPRLILYGDNGAPIWSAP
jgi:hypothetical protein